MTTIYIFHQFTTVQLVIRVAANFEEERSTHSLPCQINSLILIVCLHYVNFVSKINKLELDQKIDVVTIKYYLYKIIKF